jgi:uncharacterized protein
MEINNDSDINQIPFNIDFLESKLLAGRNHSFQKIEPIDTITIFTTNNCNLQCTYCFEHADKTIHVCNMKLDIFINTFTELFLNRGFARSVTISFFGGEPLLNFPFILKAVEYINNFGYTHDINFNYSITTNGTILNDEIIHFLMDNHFQIMVSIDGTKTLHDKNRLFKNGKGSYDTILENINKIPSSVYKTARVSLTNFEYSFEDIYNSLIRNDRFDTVHILPVTNPYTEINHDTISKWFDNVSSLYLHHLHSGNIPAFSNFTLLLYKLKQGFKNSRRFFPCKAFRSYASMLPDGSVIGCHRFNKDQFRDLNSKVNLDTFSETYSIDNKPGSTCSTCWARYLCGGTCYYNSYLFYKNIGYTNAIDCAYMKTMIKSALFVFTSMSKESRELIFNSTEKEVGINEPK